MIKGMVIDTPVKKVGRCVAKASVCRPSVRRSAEIPFLNLTKLGWTIGFVAAVMLLQTTVCKAWSLNPFAAEEPKPRKVTTRTVKNAPAPSAWDKITAGTKQFFDKTGETLGLKKPAPRRPGATAMAIPRQPQLAPRKKPEQKSWFSSVFGPEEKKDPKSVDEWMGATSQINP